MVARMMERMGSTVRAWGTMYKSVARLVLLNSIKSWVATGEMLKVLEGFHHRSARWIMGMTEKRREGRVWDHP